MIKQQNKKIQSRLAEIEKERELLDAEFSMLLRVGSRVAQWPHLVREGDEFSHRTANKFELLADIAKYLSQEDPLLYGGASTRELFEAIALPTNERAEERHGKTKPSVNYNTFRSYLARFRTEGRIFFDSERKRWRLSEEDWALLRSNEDEEDERNYS